MESTENREKKKYIFFYFVKTVTWSAKRIVISAVELAVCYTIFLWNMVVEVHL